MLRLCQNEVDTARGKETYRSEKLQLGTMILILPYAPWKAMSVCMTTFTDLHYARALWGECGRVVAKLFFNDIGLIQNELTPSKGCHQFTEKVCQL